MSEDWSAPTPILGTADGEKSLRFYCDTLGFTKDWEHRFADGFPLYAQVSRGPVCLHLSEHGDSHPVASMCIGVANVDDVYAEFTGRGLKADCEPEDREYGIRDFSFKDPDGHSFVICSRLDNFDEAPGRSS